MTDNRLESFFVRPYNPTDLCYDWPEGPIWDDENAEPMDKSLSLVHWETVDVSQN